MGLFGSGSLGWRRARDDRARRLPAALLAAFVWIALVAPLEAPAQEPPWDIESIQWRLVELGYEAGEVDGLLGPNTRAALRAFQADSDLPVNGLPDGPTQDALFAPEPPESTAGAPASGDDPPSLEAVPLEPVSAEPLATWDRAKPHEGITLDRPEAQAPDEPAPDEPAPDEPAPDEPAPDEPEPPKSAPAALTSVQAKEAAETVETKPRKKWLTWSAAGLGGLGLVLLFAALRGRSRKREQVAAEPPRPAAAEATQPVAVAPSGVGHVFGVDVPHSLPVSERGKRGSGGAG